MLLRLGRSFASLVFHQQSSGHTHFSWDVTINAFQTKMLLIHWTPHNNLKTIIKNGIKMSSKTYQLLGSEKDSNVKIKGVWCYPFTYNKSINNNWKRNLKSWRFKPANYNGVIFKLEESDFPLYANSWVGMSIDHEKCIANNLKELNKVMEQFPTTSQVNNPVNGLDTIDFEIILPRSIEPSRIIKIIKDREPKKTDGNKR